MTSSDMTSSDCGLTCQRQNDCGGQNLPVIVATGCRMPRSPSRDKDFGTCVRSSGPQQQPFAPVVCGHSTPNCSYPDTFFKRTSRDATNSAWFEDENDLIKSCGALQSALGLSKSFSTSDVSDATAAGGVQDPDYWPADNEDIRVPRSASELAISKLRIDSDVLLMPAALHGRRLGNASRSLSTCVVVGDMASTSQLPSPNRYSSTLQNHCAPSAFTSTDLVRSVNKKVRQNYIQRRLLITYKTLERLSQSGFDLDKTIGTGRRPTDRGDDARATGNPSGKFLCVPRSGKPLCPDDIAVCTDTIKRYQPKTFTRYDRNMFIVDWLDNIDPQNTAAAAAAAAADD